MAIIINQETVPGSYNLPRAYKGSLYPSREIQIVQDNIAVNLTDYNIVIEFQNVVTGEKPLRLTVGSGITKTDAVNGIFTMNEIGFSFSGIYKYDIKLCPTTGIPIAVLKGFITIENNIAECS